MPAVSLTDLNNAKTDLDKWKEIQTTTAATVTLRTGEVVPSRKALFDGLSAAAAITATGVNRTGAETARSGAEAAKTASETARDVALAAGPIYADESTGRAAVADGVAFIVQGSGDAAGFAFRRVSSGSSVLIGTIAGQSAVRKTEMTVDRAASIPWLSSAIVIGDSRGMEGQRKWKNGSIAAPNGLEISSAFVGPAHPEATNGTLEYEYRSGDRHLRWTANGDTAGPWYPMFAGIMDLDSGTAGSELRLQLGVKSVTSAPATDTSVTIAVSGSLYYGNDADGAIEWAMHYLRWPFLRVSNLAIGGNTTGNVVEQLAALRWRAAGPGVAFVILGTNDISSGVALATITANLTTIYDRLASQGLRLVIIGEHARWGAAASTPMTAGQITTFDGIRAFQKLYAHQNGHIFVDGYALTYDSGASDRRPAAGMLADQVHLSPKGAQTIGADAATKAAAWIGRGKQIDSSYDSNLLAGYFAGSGGSNGTGSSGSVPNDWVASRASGTAPTVVNSVPVRTDGVAGNWWKMVVSGASAGIIEGAMLSPRSTLAVLGLAIGDEIEMSCEFKAENLVNIGGLRVFVQFSGTTGPRTVMLNHGNSTDVLLAGAGVLKAPRIAIPAGATHVRAFIWIYVNAGGSGDLYFANFRYRKITQSF